MTDTPPAVALTHDIAPARLPARGLHVVMTANTAWNIWNFRRALVGALLEDGHRVTILSPEDDSVGQLRGLGAGFRPISISAKGLNPAEGPGLFRAYRAEWHALAPDCVLGFTIKPNLFGAMAARAAGVPFIPNVTGLGTAFLTGGVLQFAAERLYSHAFRKLPVVFFQNADDRDLFIARKLAGAGQARVLPGSGVDTAHFMPAPLPEGPVVFLMISRLIGDKGVREYAHAARILRAERSDAEFRLLGALGAENRSAIARHELEDWQREGIITYLGATDDVRPAIADAHCVVLPSYREGAPRTLIEAAAMARPLIASDVPGCRAVVDHERTGFLCAARDGNALADACRAFLALPQLGRQAMGAAARAKIVTEYDQERVIAAYRDALSEITTPDDA